MSEFSKTEVASHSVPETQSIDPENQTKDIENDLSQTPTSPRAIHGIKWTLVVFGTLSSIFLYALDNTITANIIPVVVADLGESNKLAWLSVSFMIGGVAVLLPISKLYGLFNARSLYLGSVVLFMVGSAVCGAAPTLNAFIVGRVIAGIGGNGMYLGVMTLVSVNTNDKERPMYLGLSGLVFGLGMVAGPLIGGAFAESTVSWRFGFYINLCVGGLFAPVFLFLIPGFDPRGFGPNGPQAFWSRFREFDYPGAIFSIGTLVCIIMAINFGGTLYAWSSGRIIALFVLSGLLLIMFAIQQSFALFTKPAYLMFPTMFLRNKEAVLLFILMATGNAGGFIPLYYIPTYFQFTQADSPLNSAVKLLPLIIFFSAAVISNGALMTKFGYYQPWYIVGSALSLVATVLLSRITTTTPTSNIYGFEVLLGIGSGAINQAGYAVIQGVIDPSLVAYGLGFMMLAQLLGITLGLSIAGAIFVNVAVKNLQAVVPGVNGGDLQSAILGTSGNFFDTLSPASKTAALGAIVDAMRKLLIPSYVAFAVAFVTSIFLKRQKLHAG